MWPFLLMKNKLRFYFLLIIGGIISCRPSGHPSSDNQVTVPAEKKNSPQAALYQLNDRIQKNPTDAAAYFERGQIFFSQKDLDQAYLDVSKAVSLDSTKAGYYLLLADINFKGFHIQKTVQAFEKCLQIDPKNMEARLKLAELYLYIKGYPKALEYANDALRLDKRQAKAYFIKGFVYKETHDTASAISSFETVIELQPENYDALIQLGNLCAARNMKAAEQYYNNALHLSPRSTEALYDRGLYYQNSGQLEKAIADYQTLLNIDPKYADAYFNMGFIDLVLKKEYRASIIHFSDAIRANPNFADAFYNRGMAYLMLGDKSAAKKDFQDALKIFPTYAMAKDQLQ